MSKLIDDIKTLNKLNIGSTIESDNITTGSLLVSGGIGVLKNVNIGGSLSMTGDFKIKSNTTDSGIITFNVPNDDVTNYTITWPRTQGLIDQMLLNDGNGNLSWNDFPSSATTGSLVVTGITSLDTLDTTGAATMGSTLNVTGNTTIGGGLTITDTTQSTSTGVGALIVNGGVGIDKGLTLGGKLALSIRFTSVDTTLDDDYILNVSAAATITLPDITNDQYNGVSYLIIKQTGSNVIIATQAADKIVDSGAEVDSITLDGGSGERIHVISNSDKWFVI